MVVRYCHSNVGQGRRWRIGRRQQWPHCVDCAELTLDGGEVDPSLSHRGTGQAVGSNSRRESTLAGQRAPPTQTG